MGVDGFKPLLPPGGWLEAKYLGHQTTLMFNTAKLFLNFEIVEAGEYLGVRLFRAFRISKLVGRPGPGGKFVAHSGGELYRLMVRLLDVKLRKDRLTFRPLRSMLFKVKTRTVAKDHQQRPLPSHAQYSVIEEIERGE